MLPFTYFRLVPVLACCALAGEVGAWTPSAQPGEFARDLPAAGPAPTPADRATLRFSSLAELAAHALTARPETRAVWLAMQAEAARLDAANAADWPVLTGQFGLTRNRGLSTSGTVAPTLNRYGPTLSLAWTLYDFGARAAGQDAQRARLLAAAYAANRQLQTVVGEVEATYAALLGARARVDAQTESTAALKASHDAATARFSGGLATRADTLRAQAALAEAALALQAAERDVLKAEAALKLAAGVEQTRALVLAWAGEPPPLADAPAVLDELLAEAARLRPDLAALAALAEAARAEAGRAEAARLPVVALAANSGRTFFLDDGRGPSTSYSVGINLNVPLADGGRLRAEARAARRVAEQAEAEAAARRRQIAREVADARADVVYAQSQRAGVAAQFAAAAESARAAAARYGSGLGSLLELLTAQADLARARQVRAQADSDWLAAFSRLNQALGRLPAFLP